MNIKNPKFQKTVSSILIISMFLPAIILFSTPKPVEAVGEFDIVAFGQRIISNIFGSKEQIDTWKMLREQVQKRLGEVLKQAKSMLIRKLLAEMTKSTVNWINTGFHGKPLFLENPRSFFRNMAKTNFRDYVDLVGYDEAKFPFGRQFALDAIKSYKTQFADMAASSLSNVTDDPELLRKMALDFNVGGWDGFLAITQYPTNNVIGARMAMSEQLMGQLEGTVLTEVNKVKTVLQEGMGFLSPQICKSNPNWKAGSVFSLSNYQKTNKPPVPTPGSTNFQYQINIAAYNRKLDEARKKFYADYGCPEEITTTTPGAVVSSKIINALRAPEKQGEISQLLGQSFSVVFDTLFNKLAQDGLTSLSNKLNKKPELDSWSYEGQTLAGNNANVNGQDDWANQADEFVDLIEFRKEIEGETIIKKKVLDDETEIETIIDQSVVGNIVGTPKMKGETDTKERIFNLGKLALANQEIQILFNGDSQIHSEYRPPETKPALELRPGAIQTIDLLWPLAKALDQCLPGPDQGWGARLNTEKDKSQEGLKERAGKPSDGKDGTPENAKKAINNINFAASFFKDWVNNKIIFSLPSAILFQDSINQVETLFVQKTELNTRKQELNSSIARLTAIGDGLIDISRNLRRIGSDTQPASGSDDEKLLIAYRKQYKAIEKNLSSTGRIDDAQSILYTATNQKEELERYNKKCENERFAKGWSVPGGPDSKLYSVAQIPEPTIEIPEGAIGNGGGDNTTPGETPLPNDPSPENLPTDPLGQITVVENDDNDNVEDQVRAGAIATRTPSGTVVGTEQDLFCNKPIWGGYDAPVPTAETITRRPGLNLFGVLRNIYTGGLGITVGILGGHSITTTSSPTIVKIGNQTYPILNVFDVYHYRKWRGGVRQRYDNKIINIILNCNLIYKATNLDYKNAGDYLIDSPATN